VRSTFFFGAMVVLLFLEGLGEELQVAVQPICEKCAKTSHPRALGP
jgi:hypothetical protein